MLLPLLVRLALSQCGQVFFKVLVSDELEGLIFLGMDGKILGPCRKNRNFLMP